MSTTKKRRGAGEGSIRLRSDGRWEGRYELGWTSEGRQRRSVFGRTRQEVVIKLREAATRQGRGLPVSDERVTVASFLRRWLEAAQPSLRPSTATRYRGIVEHQIIPAIGTLKLTKLQPTDVARMLARLQEQGLSPMTASHVRSVLRGALGDGEKWGEVSRNVAKLTKPPKVEGYHVEPMNPDQALAILDAVAGGDLEAPVAVALWTGLRQGELLALQWSDVDLSAHRVSVSATLQRRGREWHVEPTKTAKSRRTIGLPSPAVETLTVWRQRQLEQRLRIGPRWATRWGDLVFTDPTGQPVMAATLTHNFRSVLERAGLRPVRFHDLRHAAATLMLASGTDLKVVSEVLGHSTIATTANVYAGVLDSLKGDAADRLAHLVRRSG